VNSRSHGELCLLGFHTNPLPRPLRTLRGDSNPVQCHLGRLDACPPLVVRIGPFDPRSLGSIPRYRGALAMELFLDTLQGSRCAGHSPFASPSIDGRGAMSAPFLRPARLMAGDRLAIFFRALSGRLLVLLQPYCSKSRSPRYYKPPSDL
jgi:hypothetical protein